MEKYFEVLARCPLFAGIRQEEAAEMLKCLGGRVVKFPKGSPVFLEGDPAKFMGVVLEGAVQVVREDYYGNRSVLTVVGPGGLFAEAFAYAGVDTLPVSVFALQESAVLLLDCGRVLTGCANACAFHARLISNLLRGISRKNLTLTQKIRYMSRKTTREKLLEYLMDQAKLHGSDTFTIPYDRQALADFLGVERSAMSAEIGKLRRAGVLETKGAWFRILKAE